jgi:hypothetical protein
MAGSNVITTFRVWLFQKEFPHRAVPDWKDSHATILMAEQMETNSWEISVPEAHAEAFRHWLKTLEEQGWVAAVTRVQPGRLQSET